MTTRPASVSAVLLGVAVVLGAAACGASERKPLPLRRWLSYSLRQRTGTLTALAGYNGVYGGFNFNGYGKGEVLVSVPRGWKVTVRCVDRSGSVRHSCAVVGGVSKTAPAFPGASSRDPEQGLAPGQAGTFAFVASRVGVYRLASLVPDQEQAGMWDVFEVTRSGKPSVRQLRR